MRRMENEFQCNICDTWVPGTVLIAETKEEFDKAAKGMPPLTVQLGPKLIFSHNCPRKDCTGKVNIVYAIADF